LAQFPNWEVHMPDSKADRVAPLSGVVFLVVALLGALVLYPSDAPDFVDDPAKIAAFYNENDGDILMATVAYMLSSFFLLWFVGTLRSHIRSGEGASGRLAGIAFGGGVTAATLLLAAAGTEAVAALRVDEQDAIDPQMAAVYSDLSSILFGAAAPFGMAVLLAASAVAGFRFRVLPAWLAGIAAVLALGCIIPPISFMVLIVSFFWIGATGVVLYVSAKPPAPPAAPTAAPAA
jgi:hypothetical protein